MFWVMFGWDLIDKKIINCEQYIFNISLLSQIGEGNGPLSDYLNLHEFLLSKGDLVRYG